VEIAPLRREKDSFIAYLPRPCQLPLDLVRRKKIIRVESLDIVFFAEVQGVVPGRRSTLIPLRYYFELV
jgi:hypothetical protein